MAAKQVKGLFATQADVASVPPAATITGPAASSSPSPTQPSALRNSSTGEEELLKVHPSMFRNRPLRFCILLLIAIAGLISIFAGLKFARNGDELHVAIAVGVGITTVPIVMLLLWWLRYRQVTLIVTDKRTIYRYGLLSRYVKEVRHSDVRMLVVKQSFSQRLFGVGQLDVSSAAADESDIRITGIANPERVKDLIDGLRV